MKCGASPKGPGSIPAGSSPSTPAPKSFPSARIPPFTNARRFAFRPAAILGQNWDWAERLEDLSVSLRIVRDDAPTIRMISEPGIVGKIGMNEHGLGVCLNILRLDRPLNGVPIHVVLRAILDCRTLQEARNTIRRAGCGTASNVLVADDRGDCLDVEFLGDEAVELEEDGPVVIHTNHALSRDLHPPAGIFASSHRRYRVTEERTKSLDEFTVAAMKSALSDCSDPDLPVCRSYLAHPVLGRVGTVCSIVMDLPERTLHVRKGNATEGIYVPLRVDE